MHDDEAKSFKTSIEASRRRQIFIRNVTKALQMAGCSALLFMR